MAISAYSSASWFARILLLALVFTSLMLLMQVFTDTASLIRGTRSTVLVSDRGSADLSNVMRNSASNFSQPTEIPEFKMDSKMEEGGQAIDVAGEQEEEDAKEEDESASKIASDLSHRDAPGDSDKFGRPLGDAAKRLPDALIIGARKGGTRALITFLAMHPKVVTTGDEVQFFNNNDSYAKGLGWYIEQMPAARSDQVLIEKTAEYFHVLWVPERVKQMNPDIKIMLVIRDPFIRMVSDYNFLRRFAAANTVEGYEFPELKYTLEELAVDNATGSVNTAFGGLHRSKYYKFFGNWLKHFPRQQIHIINGDRLASENPALELSKVEQFLGVDQYFTESFFYKDEEKGFYCITDVGCLGSEKGHKQPDFNPEFVKKVRSFLRPMNLLFYNQAGYDFNWE